MVRQALIILLNSPKYITISVVLTAGKPAMHDVTTAQTNRPAITDAERERRQRITEQSEHSLRLEEMELSDFARGLAAKWVAGEITSEECEALILEHYGLG